MAHGTAFVESQRCVCGCAFGLLSCSGVLSVLLLRSVSLQYPTSWPACSWSVLLSFLCPFHLACHDQSVLLLRSVSLERPYTCFCCMRLISLLMIHTRIACAALCLRGSWCGRLAGVLVSWARARGMVWGCVRLCAPVCAPQWLCLPGMHTHAGRAAAAMQQQRGLSVQKAAAHGAMCMHMSQLVAPSRWICFFWRRAAAAVQHRRWAALAVRACRCGGVLCSAQCARQCFWASAAVLIWPLLWPSGWLSSSSNGQRARVVRTARVWLSTALLERAPALAQDCA
jgi:hypothetical protein